MFGFCEAEKCWNINFVGHGDLTLSGDDNAVVVDYTAVHILYNCHCVWRVYYQLQHVTNASLNALYMGGTVKHLINPVSAVTEDTT